MKNLLIAIAALAMATPAFAQNTVTAWSSRHYDVDGSTPGNDPLCMMSSTFDFEGRASVKFLLGWDGVGVVLILTSLDWSAVDGREYEGFTYVFPGSDVAYDATVNGHVSGYIYKGFGATFNPAFLDYLAADDRLLVYRKPDDEESVVVADLNLIGTSAAVAALRRCFDHVQRREAARIERERANDYIARDPFAD